MHLSVHYNLGPKQRSTNAALVMDHFGIGFEQGSHVIAENLELPIEAGDVVCFTGESGSGKSSLMRAAAAQLSGVVFLDDLELGDRILVDALPLPALDAIRLLSSCGLTEARLLLRTPRELSDGERYRFRLALGLAGKPNWLIADEFTATLDRTLAKAVAFNVGRIAQRTGIGFLLATTHEDILSDLAPTLHVRCRLDGDIACERAERQKKDASVSPANFRSRPARNRTGRISLGGITGRRRSGSCGSSPCCGMATSQSASACLPLPRDRSRSAAATSACRGAGREPSCKRSTAKS